MKRKNIALRLTLPREPGPDGGRPSLLLGGLPVFLGLWGMARGLLGCGFAWGAAGLCTLAAAILLSWDRAWQRRTALGLCALALGACLLGAGPIGQGLAALANGVGELLTRKTGYYHLPYETAGMNGRTAGLLSALLGAVTGAAVRYGRGIPHLLCAPVLLALCLGGLVEAELWWGLYLGGTALLVLRLASGTGRPLAAGALLLLLGGGLLGWLCPGTVRASAGVLRSIHALRCESAPNPMPEGTLRNLGPFAPGAEPALALTMEDWQPLYIRGFVGGSYQEEGWAPAEQAAPEEETRLQYILQRDCFSPAAQMGAAAAGTEGFRATPFTLEVLDACRAWAYVPYGASGLEEDPRALRGEGLSPETSRSGVLYHVQESYLLQKALGEGLGDQEYAGGEAVYRAWVYDRYLEVPEEARRLLEEHFSLPEEALTTAQARQLVRSMVEACLTYDESARASAGDTPFLEYLLTINPRGYSVQYATLSTLLMRCCGIPARYVEGYLLPEARLAGAEPGDTLILTQEDSHAWTEIYLDGVGWIPFDTTPNHKEELTYTLPPGGSGGETETPEAGENPYRESRQEITIRQEGQKDRGTREGMGLLWLIPLLLLPALVLRTVALRRRLRRRVAAFSTGPAREAVLDCLGYTGELLARLGLPRRNVPVTRRAGEIAALVPRAEPEAVVQVLAMGAELRFSPHGATEAQRALALRALDTVRARWQEKTGPGRRFLARFVECGVL